MFTEDVYVNLIFNTTFAMLKVKIIVGVKEVIVVPVIATVQPTIMGKVLSLQASTANNHNVASS